MRIFSDVDEGTWRDVAQSCPYATFFHSPLWADLATAEDSRRRVRTIGAELSNGTTAILPMIQEWPSGTVAFRRLHSTFAGCYGGVIANGPLTDEVSKLYAEACGWQTSQFTAVESPLDEGGESVPTLGSDNAYVEEDFTQILTLDTDFETIYENFSKDRRYGYRKARDAGVTVRKADSLQDYRDYYGAYQESVERWDDVSVVYGWSLFERMYELAQERPDRITLWVTEIEGDVASGAVVFYLNDHAVNWHAASYAEYFDYYINDYIHAEIIEDAIERGYQYYDFNPSGGNEGVVKFKAEFGPEKWPIRRLHYEDAAFRFGEGALSEIERLRENLTGGA